MNNEQNKNIYSWSFSGGKRVSGNGFSIGIPDGYTKVDSKDDKFKQSFNADRQFIFVPKNEIDSENVLVTIMSGASSDKTVEIMDYIHHPKALAAFAGLYGTRQAEAVVKAMSIISSTKIWDIITYSGNGICAYGLVQDTGMGSISYQITVLMGNGAQHLRVQTQPMDESERAELTTSIKNWISTFQPDTKNTIRNTSEPFADVDKCVNELTKGIMQTFKSYAEAANNEYGFVMAAGMELVKLLGENGMPMHEVEQRLKKVLKDSLDVREYNAIRADKVVQKAKASGVNDEIMKRVYDAIIGQVITSINIDGGKKVTANGRKIEIKCPPELNEILERWNAELEEYGKLRKAEEEKKAEERRKAEKKRHKAEEERRKAEKEKIEAAKKKYETIVKELENREKELDNMLSGATAKKAEEVKRELSKKQQELQDEYESAKKAYESLGFFKFKDKSIAKKSMRNAEEKLKSFNINNEITRRIESINLTADKIRKAYKKEIDLYLDYRFPNRNITTKIKLSELDEMKKNIFDILRSNNSGMKVTEITEALGGEHPPQKISALMRQMVSDCYAEREINRNFTFFRVASDTKVNPYIKEDKDAFFKKYSENEEMKDKPYPDLPEIII